MRTILTKNEIRQTLTKDPAVIWYREKLLQKFDTAKLLRGAPTAERLWQIKGISEVLNFIENPETILDFFDNEELSED